MELNTPEERIAKAWYQPGSPEFMDLCNAIRPYWELEKDREWLAAFVHFRSRKAQARADLLLVTDLIHEYQDSVNQKRKRIELLEAAQKNVRPIRP